MKYTSVDVVDLDLGKGIDNLISPIGEIDVFSVNEIKDLPYEDWIYLEGEPNGSAYQLGLYKSDKVKLNTLADFDAISVDILSISNVPQNDVYDYDYNNRSYSGDIRYIDCTTNRSQYAYF
jgi:hypothetical protein